MMNTDDLNLLDMYAAVPADHRLAAALEGALAGETYKQREADLATHLGYTRPHVVKQWLDHDTIIPLRHLPAIARFTGVHLSVLVTFWIATCAADDDEAGVISSSIAPRITDGEFAILETARAVYQDEADDRLEP